MPRDIGERLIGLPLGLKALRFMRHDSNEEQGEFAKNVNN
jgi:hypothetical protein